MRPRRKRWRIFRSSVRRTNCHTGSIYRMTSEPLLNHNAAPTLNSLENRRILFVDDMEAIHEDFRKIFAKAPAQPSLEDDGAVLFGATKIPTRSMDFAMDSAFQGKEALEKLRASLNANCPYSMAFIDMR